MSEKPKLPPLGKYVLVHYNGGNWYDPADPDGVYWLVAKRTPCEVGGNHTEAYRYETFGPTSLFSWQVDRWAELPKETVSTGVSSESDRRGAR